MAVSSINEREPGRDRQSKYVHVHMCMCVWGREKVVKPLRLLCQKQKLNSIFRICVRVQVLQHHSFYTCKGSEQKAFSKSFYQLLNYCPPPFLLLFLSKNRSVIIWDVDAKHKLMYFHSIKGAIARRIWQKDDLCGLAGDSCFPSFFWWLGWHRHQGPLWTHL